MDVNNRVRKAVFPVAGLGTRFLPATKAMPKELLPVINKPLIQYAAEEAVDAGIDTLIFVTGRNKRAIEDHFDNNLELVTVLREQGKYDHAHKISKILPEHVECIFVRQAEQLGLGHAILCAERAIGGEPFAVLLADDFITDSKTGVTRTLIKNFEKTMKSQLSVMSVKESEVSNYGVVEFGLSKDKVVGLVEKPKIENAPSNSVSIGRYLLTNEIFDILRNLEPGINGEIQLADAINIQAKQGNVDAIELDGVRFDCGGFDGYIGAINYQYNKKNL